MINNQERPGTTLVLSVHHTTLSFSGDLVELLGK